MEGKKVSRNRAILRFIIFSFIGAFSYFVPVTINGKNAVLIDHLTTLFRYVLGGFLPYYTLAIVLWGGVAPIVTGKFKESKADFLFSLFKFLGIFVGVMAVFNIGPNRLLEDDMIPFLFNSLVVPIGLIIPIALILLTFIVNYGLMEFVAVFMEPIMRPIWKTPGKSAIDAVVSFTGGYSIAMLLTNDLYKSNVYTKKEAAIITTGFSTVSIAFLLIISNTLELGEHWNLYFWSTLVITFIVTAITARLYPIRKMDDTYLNGKTPEDNIVKENLFKRALNEAIDTAQKADPITTNLKKAFLGESLKMATAVMSSILSIGLVGICLATFTPVFDYVAYIFYPFVKLLQIPEPMLASKAAGIGLAEMFLPTLIITSAPLVTKFIIAVMSVSTVLFFSASIPCLLSTDINVSIKNILIIWFERTLLSIILATPIAFIFLTW